ncbi:MAG: LacI family DNA-binding transcriptional regulator [Oscillospiraceae bacterium]
MKDIAELAGISTATVSKIINGADQHISETTRRKVLEIVNESGYVPNAVAKGLKIKQTKMIGFVLPDISNPFFPEVARGIENAAKERGFGVVMCNTDDSSDQELERFRFLSSRMVDGIVFTRSLRRGNLDKYFKSGMPIVVVDREVDTENFGFGQIFVDTQKGIYESTKVLINAGCRKIAFVSADYASGYDRFVGYSEALLEAGMDVNEALVYRDLYNVETGYEGLNKILRDNVIDGVVCGNDLIALGVMNALSEHKLTIPDDVKVMGFDDVYFSKYLNPALSTVYQPAYEMGAQAARMLIENILYSIPLHREKLDFKILMRGTV